jgi:hypothetical protein
MNVITATTRCVTATALAAGLTTATVAISSAKEDTSQRGGESYTIGLFGDTPYNALGRAQYPALLADINASHVAFSVFDGDLKAGGDGPCSDDLYTTALTNFNTLRDPLIVLPGDNRRTRRTSACQPGAARC